MVPKDSTDISNSQYLLLEILKISTFYYGHQSRLASQLGVYSGNASKKFLYQGEEIVFGQRVFLRNLPNMNLFFNFIREKNKDNIQILRCSQVKSHGTKYMVGSIIVLECIESSLPLFAKIK